MALKKGKYTTVMSDPVTVRENNRFRDWRPIHEQLPLTFDNGYVIWSLSFVCLGCNDILPENGNLRGEIREIPQGNWRVTGHGFCEKCNLLTPILANLVQNNEGKVDIKDLKRKQEIPISGADIVDFFKGAKNGKKGKDKK